jgi:ferritin-like metal-binding protein YciE
VRTWARLLGHRGQARLLQQTLNEEGATDKALTKLSERINVAAE